MRNKLRLLAVMLVVAGLLSSCTNTLPPAEKTSNTTPDDGSLGLTSAQSSPAESPLSQENSVKESEKTELLPDAYYVQNGKLFLTIEPQTDLGSTAPTELSFASMEDMKEKFLNLSFTESELVTITKLLAKNSSFSVIDPRLLFSLCLPEGVTLNKAVYWSDSFRYGLTKSEYYAQIDFDTKISDVCSFGESYSARIRAYPSLGSQHKEFLTEGWTDASGGFDTSWYMSVEETSYKGTPALLLKKTINEFTWNCLRYTLEENGRTCYVSERTQYEGEELLIQTIHVYTFYDNCEYYYSIRDPSQDCIDNILLYNPFAFEKYNRK